MTCDGRCPVHNRVSSAQSALKPAVTRTAGCFLRAVGKSLEGAHIELRVKREAAAK